MSNEQLANRGVVGWRLKISDVLKTKAFDIGMITLIILYTLLIFLFFALDGTQAYADHSTPFYVIELVILGVFSLEIFFHFLAYGELYFYDKWNIFDIFIIILSILFVLLDILVDNKALKGFLKIRGVFRLLRIFILIRKLNVLRVKRDLQRKKMLSVGYTFSTPLEKVLEILNDLRDKIDPVQLKIFEDLNYCIKMISSN